MMTTRSHNKGQNTAEYALLIALVVAAVIAMQTFSQRSLQARVRDAAKFMVNETSGAKDPNDASVVLGSTEQYEPYYQKSDYTVNRASDEYKRLGKGTVASDSYTNRERAGYQETTYNNEADNGL